MSDPYAQPSDPAKRHSAKLTDGVDRAPARAMLKGIGLDDEALARPLIGIATNWIETMPCNWNQRELARHVRRGIIEAGGTPMEFNTVAVSDGVSMGTEGMRASLVSREVIADSVERLVAIPVARKRIVVIDDASDDGTPRILAAILFLQTMERTIEGVPTARYLWETKNVVPFLKVDLGLAAEQDDVQLMKPITTIDDVLERANAHQIFGTKMRSVIKDANEAGIAAIVDQQFDYGARIAAAGIVPIIEPEVSISSPHKEQAETLLHDAIATHLKALPEDATVMLKITITTRPGLYGDLASDPRVLRVLALSGRYSRDEACARLARDPTLIASFSRALLEGLTESQTDEQFNAQLESSIEQIYQASVHKQPASP